MASSIYIPVQPGVALDPNGYLRDLEFQFLRMVRNQDMSANWHTRFAYVPPGSFASLKVDLPIDLSSFAFTPWKGIPTFSQGTNVKIRCEIDPFWSGTYLDVRALRDPNANEVIGWNQRAEALMGAWDRHLPPKIYDLIDGGEAALSDPHPVTGGAAFFDTTHYYNRDHEEYGTFSNLIGNGGALAAVPIYAILSGGSLTNMKPWGIFRGDGMADAIKTAGGQTSARKGEPWVIKWGATSDEELIERNMQVRLGVYAERGYGLLFPHTIVRFEGTLDYAGLLSILTNAIDRKDLNGFQQSSQTRIEAFLVQNASQQATINGLLGRDITDTASTGVKIDPRLKSAEVIIMDR